MKKSWICTSVWLQQRSSSRDHTGAAFCWVSPGVCWEWLKAEFPLPVTEAGVGSGWDLEPAKAGREENGISPELLSPELLSSALTHRTNPSPAQGQPGHSSGREQSPGIPSGNVLPSQASPRTFQSRGCQPLAPGQRLTPAPKFLLGKSSLPQNCTGRGSSQGWKKTQKSLIYLDLHPRNWRRSDPSQD